MLANKPPKPIGKVLHSENSNLTDRQPHFSRTPITVEFKKKNGDEVKAGEIVVVLEAMKMMNNFEANKDGVISGIKFDSGDTVVKGDILFTIE